MNTTGKLIESRLMKMDYEMHTLMREIRVSGKSITLNKLVHEIKSNLKEDYDTTELLKETREKKYDL